MVVLPPKFQPFLLPKFSVEQQKPTLIKIFNNCVSFSKHLDQFLTYVFHKIGSLKLM